MAGIYLRHNNRNQDISKGYFFYYTLKLIYLCECNLVIDIESFIRKGWIIARNI